MRDANGEASVIVSEVDFVDFALASAKFAVDKWCNSTDSQL